MGERGGAKQRRPRYGEVGRTSVRPGLSHFMSSRANEVSAAICASHHALCAVDWLPGAPAQIALTSSRSRNDSRSQCHADGLHLAGSISGLV